VLVMRLVHRITGVSDRRLSRLLGVGVLVLAVGVPAFGVLYFRDQHVDAGPSLVDRQVVSAEAAVRAAPGDIGLRLQLAGAYRTAGRLDAALAQYDQTLTVEAANRAALLGRGDVLVAKKDLPAAAAAFAKIVGAAKGGEFAAADPQLEKAHYRLGQIALQQGRVGAAVTSLSAAVRIEPTDADALYLLGTAQLREGKAARAVVSLQRAVAFVPTGWCEPYTRLSQAFRSLHRAPAASYATAMLDFCRGRPAVATRQLTALTSGPVAVPAMLGLGMIAETTSDRAAATRWYQKVLRADSKNFNARTGLTRLGAGSSS
jgi:tetratricopeptide (TPR) repeat protein